MKKAPKKSDMDVLNEGHREAVDAIAKSAHGVAEPVAPPYTPPAVPAETRSKAPDPVPYVAPYKADVVTKEAFWKAVSEMGHDLYQHPKEHAYAEKYLAALAEKLGFQP